MRKNYIAYGSNLNLAQMAVRCPDARAIGTAQLEGWRLMFKGSKTGSFLTIEKDEGSQVPVAIWSVSEKDEKKLDRYEGYPGFYFKQNLEVEVKDIETGEIRKEEAFVYIMREERAYGIPSEYYMRVCQEGYEDFGFDEKYIKEACVKSAKEAKSWK